MEDAVRIFRLVATEFDVLNDETVEAWLNLTAPLISKKVFGKPRKSPAMMTTKS